MTRSQDAAGRAAARCRRRARSARPAAPGGTPRPSPTPGSTATTSAPRSTRSAVAIPVPAPTSATRAPASGRPAISPRPRPGPPRSTAVGPGRGRGPEAPPARGGPGGGCGCGTGIATALLVARGADVIAVEPGEGMAAGVPPGAAGRADRARQRQRPPPGRGLRRPPHLRPVLALDRPGPEALRVCAPAAALALWWNTEAPTSWAQHQPHRGGRVGPTRGSASTTDTWPAASRVLANSRTQRQFAVRAADPWRPISPTSPATRRSCAADRTQRTTRRERALLVLPGRHGRRGLRGRPVGAAQALNHHSTLIHSYEVDRIRTPWATSVRPSTWFDEQETSTACI